ncbi:molybdenum cofactor guanylyltransferase MobA [Cohaesibacter gelatinilyticus]|uniref:Molybdenum cofactor guanylyltransferase n=1 Tax=Cohaesibacter gelatinilyticus TaxID=372072 RepID=A0A285NHX7_9HYPH|nr:molybdenum cofactor guanylyltransferase MobA [Cohaesibacter gelatinilyticus]SNZ07261.1 molybdopterin-guanine dinucleotide biosynthesis protein A [Cohaesibacter gelatinilyticus]
MSDTVIHFSTQELAELDKTAMEASEAGFYGKPVLANRWAHRTVGLVLAGGRSSRMGGEDKASLTLEGQSLLKRVEERLKPQVANLIISSNADPVTLDSNALVLADEIEGYAGPLAGLLAGMRWAQKNVPQAFWMTSAAVDTPFFPQDLVDRLVMSQGAPQPCIVLAQSGDRRHPVFGLWPVMLADSLEAFLKDGNHKVGMWADSHSNSRAIFGGPIVDGDIEIDPFFNINEPDDLEVARVIAQELDKLPNDN